MSAAATSRSAPRAGARSSSAARAAPARRRRHSTSRRATLARAPSRRAQATPIPGRLVAVGVGRTAEAVGGLADSGLVVRLTRGRLWIGLLATLLVGIVALNVVALGINASSSKVARQADGLRRANSALDARIASSLSTDNVQAEAARLGLMVSAPDDVRYLRPQDDDAKVAAHRLAAGELAAEPAYETAPVATEPLAPVAPVPADPAAVAPVAPVETAPAAPTEPTAP